MLTSARYDALPEYDLSHPACWCVGTDGTIYSAMGSGWTHAGLDPRRAVGVNVFQWYAEEGATDFLELVRDALAGQEGARVGRFLGGLWLVEACPVRSPDRGIVGALCHAHALEPAKPGPRIVGDGEVEHAMPPNAETAHHEWTVEGAIREQGVRWNPGDVLLWDGGEYYRTERVPRYTAESIIRRYRDGLLRHLAYDESCAPTDGPPLPPSRALALVP